MLNDLYEVPYIKDYVCDLNKNTITVDVPGSKSITNRALLFAMLSDGDCVLKGALFSDDSRHLISCLNDLGFDISVSEEKKEIHIKGLSGAVSTATKTPRINVGSAGTAARFLTAVLGICHGTFYLDASEQMKKRPMAPLLASMTELGCKITYPEKEGFFPYILESSGFHKHNISVNIDSSSQFLSALLIASVLSPEDFSIQVEGSHGMSYIDITLHMMEEFGVDYSSSNIDSTTDSPITYTIPAGQHYTSRVYEIEPDVSSACYFYAFAAIIGVSVIVKGTKKNSIQGDMQFLSVLEKMGCNIIETTNGLLVTGPQNQILHGVNVDMSSFSDQAITLAAIAPFTDSPVTMTGISHIRYQECDRFSAICENLTNMNIHYEAQEDSITIYPGIPTAATIHTHDDHRLAMGFALTGLRTPGMKIENPSCCRKTFENYFEVLSSAISQFRCE